MAGFFHEGSKNGASGGRKKFSIPALTIGRNKLTIEKRDWKGADVYPKNWTHIN